LRSQSRRLRRRRVLGSAQNADYNAGAGEPRRIAALRNRPQRSACFVRNRMGLDQVKLAMRLQGSA
jgi:hypothetical protein